MNKTVYLRDEEVEVWERARQLSGDRLSPVIVAALRRYVTEQEATPKGFERILVEFNDSGDRHLPKKKAFFGDGFFRQKNQYGELKGGPDNKVVS